MGIYANEIENMFEDFPYLENELQKYDNVTYHIQLFMVPQKTFKTYSELKTNLFLSSLMSPMSDNIRALDRNLYEDAIIIAESGVTNTINIDSLSMVTHPPVGTANFGATTVEMDLSLTEINSTSLVNKIALASYLCNYESYIYQPYFISIWFTGYDHSTGKPVDKIYLDANKTTSRCTYQMMFGDIKTSSEGNKTNYKIKLYPHFYESLSKDVNIVGDIGQIKVERDGATYKKFIEEFQKKINKKLLVQYGHEVISKLYHNSQPLEIILLDEQIGEAGAYSDDGSFWHISRNIKYTPESNETIVDTLKKAAASYKIYEAGKMIQVNYSNVYLGSHRGINYYKHLLYVGLVDAPGMEEIQTLAIGNEASNYITNAVLNQEEYLKKIKEMGLLKKKYYWLYNSRNTEVLSITSDSNNMWFLNNGLTDLLAIKDNDQIKTYNDFKFANTTYENTPYMFQSINPSNGYRNFFNNPKSVRYIDDIYYDYIKEKEKRELINQSSWHKIAQGNSALSDVPTSSQVLNEGKTSLDKNEKEQLESEIRYKLGMENVFQTTGHKISVDLDIVGDPYWMFYGDSTNMSSGYLVLPHFLLFQKNFHEVDSFDNYREDKLMAYNSLYLVTKIVSTFESGSFKQRLSGFVATPFLQSTKNPTYQTPINWEEKKRKEKKAKDDAEINRLANQAGLYSSMVVF